MTRFWRRPEVQHTAVVSLTALFWLAWFYLIAPLLGLMLWMVGIQMFVDELLVNGGYLALLAELQRYGLVVLGMLLAMLVWVDWNLRYYGGHNKRTHPSSPVSMQELAQQAGVTADEIRLLQGEREQLLDFDEQDHLLVIYRDS